MLKNLYAFARGIWEFRRAWTWADPARTDADPYTDADSAYDLGRDVAHCLTFRKWDF